jgi:hypothetical protein
MSAAATAAGYLYASGRLRGRAAKEQPEAKQPEKKQPPPRRREVRVAVYEPREPAAHAPQEKPRRTPKIEYRTRRWKPEGPRDE